VGEGGRGGQVGDKTGEVTNILLAVLLDVWGWVGAIMGGGRVVLVLCIILGFEHEFAFVRALLIVVVLVGEVVEWSR